MLGKSRTHRKTYPDRRTSCSQLFEEEKVVLQTQKPQQDSPDSALPRPTHPTGDRGYHTAQVYTVRFLYDASGWAYYNNGRDLAKYAPPDFRVSLARLLSPSDLPSALGAESPDFIILNRLSDVACVRQELERRQWPTKLIGFWGAGWPHRIEQLVDVVKHVDLVNFANQAYWRNTGMLKNSVCIPLGVDLEVFRPVVPFADRPRRILWMGSELNSSAQGYEAIIVHLREKLSRAGFRCDFQVTDPFGIQLLSQKEMVEWYNSGRVFLCTGTVDGMPNVALEAAACGCALISTRVGNMTELIRNGENGLLVDPYWQAFYDAILGSEPGWPHLANALRADISEWSWERRSKQIFSALRGLIENPASPRAAARKPSAQKLVGSDRFRVHSENEKADLSEKLSVFVTTVGSPTLELCLQFLEQQDCSFHVKVISNIAPMSAALQRMLDDSDTEFFVQVDEDMLLYPHAVRTLFERMNGHAGNIALHVEYLYDTHLRTCIQGVKIFRTKIVKRYPFRDVQGCESDQISRFRKDGFDYVVSDTLELGDPFGYTLGLHGTNFSRETAYLRYLVLQQRHRRKPWNWHMMTVELAEQFRNEPSELNFFSLAGALAGLTLPVTSLGEKDFRRYSQTPGFQELARFYDVISGRKRVKL
jgi:glycosyltransferase involved in cell wall biosynthesis